MNDDLVHKLESLKIEKAERQMVQGAVNEQVVAEKERLGMG